MRTLTVIVITLTVIALWQTRPSKAIEECELINNPSYCQILDKE